MRVLLGVDGSTSSDCAASLVANLAWPSGSTIEVVTAYPGTADMFGSPGMLMPADLTSDRDEATEAAALAMATDIARRFASADLTVETHVVCDRAANAILDRAAADDVDLIVLGSRGHGAIESAVLGSVSGEVVDHSPKPVLVARRERIARILLAEDGSPSAAAAAETVRLWSVLHGAGVRVLNVADLDPRWNPWLRGEAHREADEAASTQIREQHEALAQATAAELRSAGLEAEAEVQDGSPAHRLVEAAVEWDADLIVLGTHGHSGLTRLLVGSVVRSVLHHAPCSVLVVPGPARLASTAALTKAVSAG
jgi:nucleotide-binding universal stress UspA family protein